MEFELEIEGSLVDIAERGFDLGFRYGPLLAKDMVSIEVFGASKSVLVAAPSYLDDRSLPLTTVDLAQHDAAVCRARVTRVITSYMLEYGDQSFRYDPESPMIASDLAILIDLTLAGHGISCVPVQCVRAAIDAGKLIHVLPEWAAPLQPIHLFYPKRGRANAALQAFAAFLRERHAGPS